MFLVILFIFPYMFFHSLGHTLKGFGFNSFGDITSINDKKTIRNVAKKEILQETELRIYMDSIEKYNKVPLNKITDILNHIELTKLLVIVTFGFNTDPSCLGPVTLLNALIKTKKYNVILLDWSKRTKMGVLSSLILDNYHAALANAQKVGCGLGNSIKTLVNKTGVDVNSITFVGHSFGAQVMGEAAACYYKSTRKKNKLNIIWGLDPAGGIYDRLFGTVPRLVAKVASFVYLIHTDPDGFGVNESHATVDFWVNYSTDKRIRQPGCYHDAKGNTMSLRSLCNHNRAWHLFAEGILEPDRFPASSANSGLDWLGGNYKDKPTAYIRLDPVPGAEGNYYLRTKNDTPFGLKAEGSQAIHKIPFKLPPILPTNNSKPIEKLVSKTISYDKNVTHVDMKNENFIYLVGIH